MKRLSSYTKVSLVKMFTCIWNNSFIQVPEIIPWTSYNFFQYLNLRKQNKTFKNNQHRTWKYCFIGKVLTTLTFLLSHNLIILNWWYIDKHLVLTNIYYYIVTVKINLSYVWLSTKATRCLTRAIFYRETQHQQEPTASNFKNKSTFHIYHHYS